MSTGALMPGIGITYTTANRTVVASILPWSTRTNELELSDWRSIAPARKQRRRVLVLQNGPSTSSILMSSGEAVLSRTSLVAWLPLAVEPQTSP